MRALILHDDLPADPRPDELDTMVQVEAVEAALAARGHRVQRLAFGPDLAAVAEGVRAARPDVVFNLVESVLGQGRLLHLAPALLETLGVPFTGAGAEAMFLSTSKLAAKRILLSAGIPTPSWRTRAELVARKPLEGRGPWIVKSVWEHGSLGLEPGSLVTTDDPRVLLARLDERRSALGGEAFAERYVHGREYNVAVLDGPGGAECLPIPEILFLGQPADAPRVVGYKAKWDPRSREWNGTPRSFGRAPADRALHDDLRALALATWGAFGLSGWARVDFRVDGAGHPHVIDVNANPCLSPDAGFAATLERAGISFERGLARIVSAVLRPASRRPRGPHVPDPTDRR